MQQGYPVAAVRFADGEPIDDCLDTVVRALQRRGLQVEGFLQRETPGGPGCCSIMNLENISDSTRIRISQALGPGSRGCRLDPQALAEVAGQLGSSIGTRTDRIVLNRFGKGEADGHGFRAVYEHAGELDIPVLTAVRAAYEPAWTGFAGDLGCILEAKPDHVVDWALASIERWKRTGETSFNSGSAGAAYRRSCRQPPA
jgi:hypothetical protein